MACSDNFNAVSLESILKRIENLEVVGADALVAESSKAIRLLVEGFEGGRQELYRRLNDTFTRLLEARPSSAALRNFLEYVRLRITPSMEVEELRESVLRSVEEFTRSMAEARERIGEIGARRIRDDSVLLTHGYSSTVYSILQQVRREGKRVEVYVTEARPELRGREMAKAVASLGFETHLIVDAAARVFMGMVDDVLMGAEAVAANGAVLSKVGAATIALVAREARVRVMVAAGTYKFSPETLVGKPMEVEEGLHRLVADESLMRVENLHVRCPLYDVIPPRYVDVIITERGVIPPEGVYFLIREVGGRHVGSP